MGPKHVKGSRPSGRGFWRWGVHPKLVGSPQTAGYLADRAPPVRHKLVRCSSIRVLRHPWPANKAWKSERKPIMSDSETGQVTGTQDKTYNLIWYIEACLNNALRLETYIADAEGDGDAEVAELFRKAQADSRKGAEEGKRLLTTRLSG